jgi:hypothetical protein
VARYCPHGHDLRTAGQTSDGHCARCARRRDHESLPSTLLERPEIRNYLTVLDAWLAAGCPEDSPLGGLYDICAHELLGEHTGRQRPDALAALRRLRADLA